MIEEEAASWNKEPGITWLGHVDDIAGLWARAHVAVLPSRREGLPLSLLEAAACGRAMIASDVPGCREIVIHEQTGLLFPVDDVAALAAAHGETGPAPDLRPRYAAAARRNWSLRNSPPTSSAGKSCSSIGRFSMCKLRSLNEPGCR